MTRIIGAPAATVAGWHVEIDSSAHRDQDQEFIHLTKGERRRRVRFHDYGDLYDIPGLYDWLFYEALGCRSHDVIADAVHRELLVPGLLKPSEAKVLEFGAGNGIIARAIRDLGVKGILGVDILESARRAALRDNPGVYDDYLVTDLSRAAPEPHGVIERFAPNLLVSVAALGYDDIPPAPFTRALEYLSPPAVAVFTVKQDFLRTEPDVSTRSGSFAATLIGPHSPLEVLDQRPFVHRTSSTGHDLIYDSVVARRRAGTAHRDIG